ncbi:zinc-binding dehydrogenase [Streptomyces sp. NPDC058683]|uniref:zinc-binding dehydrogenase n=1 Tax=Streptomyces sp. NPDC058683 TaxID=3346597 RepID=UPI00365C9B9E
MTGALPATSRAAALIAPGRPLELLDVEIPTVIERDALLVRMTSATLCGTDVHVADGAAGGVGAALPLILGHEMVGRIVAFGDGPRTDSLGRPLTEGDRIVWTHGMCGRCRACVLDREPSLCENRRRYMSESARTYPFLNGGFSEYGYVYPTAGRVRVPDDVPDALAAASACALRTVIHGFERLGRIAATDTVVVQGAGPVGLFAVAKAVAEGAGRVIVIGGPAARLEVAAQWGADVCIDVAEVTSGRERSALVKDLTDGRGAPVVLEMSGIPAAFAEGIDMLRPGGRYLVVGQAHQRTVDFNPSVIMHKQATLIGSRSAGVDHYWKALEFLRANADRFAWDALLSHRYRLDEINEAFEAMRTWSEIKPVIAFDQA